MRVEGLTLFPEAGLSSAVITTVFVGVLVSIFFNLRLGWPLVGLVIPGYLAPLILAQPRMAAFSVLEGTFGYFFFFALTSLAHRIGVWPNLFGRDRFFAVILMSIATRMCVDGLLLNEAYPFHSVGFILTALIINYYWTSGFKSGFFMMCVTTAITVLLLRYGLMEFTNFRLSQMNYLYMDSWNALLESPKIYMVLAATAFIASRMNFSYGLDFGGLIIPALLALQWYDPMRIVITLGEAWLVYLLGSVLMRTFLSRESVLGGRKIALFFSIGFFYKLVLGFILFYFFPEIKPLSTISKAAFARPAPFYKHLFTGW
jgi:gamma-polyglutamate biosynthesis protein CapC